MAGISSFSAPSASMGGNECYFTITYSVSSTSGRYKIRVETNGSSFYSSERTGGTSYQDSVYASGFRGSTSYSATAYLMYYNTADQMWKDSGYTASCSFTTNKAWLYFSIPSGATLYKDDSPISAGYVTSFTSSSIFKVGDGTGIRTDASFYYSNSWGSGTDYGSTSGYSGTWNTTITVTLPATATLTAVYQLNYSSTEIRSRITASIVVGSTVDPNSSSYKISEIMYQNVLYGLVGQSESSPFTMPSSGKTIYYVYEVKTYNIRYMPNGGTGTAYNRTKTYGQSYTIENCSFTMTGHHCESWNTESDGSGTRFNQGSTFSGNANLTLWAQWVPNSYTLTCHYRYGSTTIAEDETSSVSYGALVSIEGHKKTISGYTFYNASPSTDFNMPASNTDILYLYTQNTYNYKLTYDLNGGTGLFPDQTSGSTTQTSWTFRIPNRDPSKANCTFLYWTDGIDTYQKNTDYIVYAANPEKQLTAIWKRDTVITKFYWHGVSDADDWNYIASGKNIQNLSANIWNTVLIPKINEVEIANNMTPTQFATVSHGESITASKYNSIKNVIATLPGAGTTFSNRSSGQEIKYYYFNGVSGTLNSIKQALNNAIDYINTH